MAAAWRAEDREEDALERLRLVAAHLADHDLGRFLQRETAHAGAERGERERLRADLVRDLERAPRGRSDDLAVRGQVLSHDGRVDHVLRRQPARVGRNRVPESDRAERDRLALDLVAARRA